MTTITYVPFDPPRRPEEYLGQSGPHNGLALEHNVLDAIATSKQPGKPPHGYLVRGEWRRSDGVRFLDIAVDRAWVMSNTDYQLIDGRLRYVCPECGGMSHRKGCSNR